MSNEEVQRDTCLYTILGITNEDSEFSISKTTVNAQWRRAFKSLQELKLEQELEDKLCQLLVTCSEVLSDTRLELAYSRTGTDNLPEATHDCELAQLLIEKLQGARRSSQQQSLPIRTRAAKGSLTGSSTDSGNETPALEIAITSSPPTEEAQAADKAPIEIESDSDSDQESDTTSILSENALKELCRLPTPPRTEYEELKWLQSLTPPPTAAQRIPRSPSREPEPEQSAQSAPKPTQSHQENASKQRVPSGWVLDQVLDHQKRPKKGMVFKIKWANLDLTTHEEFEAIKHEMPKLHEYVKRIKANNPRRVAALLKNLPELEEALKI